MMDCALYAIAGLLLGVLAGVGEGHRRGWAAGIEWYKERRSFWGD